MIAIVALVAMLLIAVPLAPEAEASNWFYCAASFVMQGDIVVKLVAGSATGAWSIVIGILGFVLMLDTCSTTNQWGGPLYLYTGSGGSLNKMEGEPINPPL